MFSAIFLLGCNDLKDDFAKSFQSSKMSIQAKDGDTNSTRNSDEGDSSIDRLNIKAESGDTSSQRELAKKYISGDDVVKSYREAYKWFLISGYMGDKSSYAQAQDVSINLTKEQIDEINVIVKLWLEEYNRREINKK